MPFTPIDLTNGSDICYTVRSLRQTERPFLSIVHIAFSGMYRTGSSGAPDARYIHGILQILDGVWRPSGIILDLTELSYTWGDEMTAVIEPPSKSPFAIVVSSKCEPAISSLCFCFGKNKVKSVFELDNFFASFEEAQNFIKHQVVQDWNAKISKNPSWGNESDIIDIASLD